MASPDKDSQFVVEGLDKRNAKNVRILAVSTNDAYITAHELARANPGETFTVWKALYELTAGEIPVEQVNFRQTGKGKNEATE